ncbi:hypothetical protein MKUB_11260 [Mycobacterium kubicae]|uniref:DUF7159 domain-containing protein n=1 Tax=Mycobacterium kubicae TaxID=120959 RepID=A0AAX1JBF1_9MYCO|nr:hypothetical protein [Mycobacterium kubicae]MCV7097964.1 hypothetical protein [Mycobacterium kubicae]ORW05486.1 hypothetical protein AWC13_25270 [Mycobacterium kubicae]QPI38551.1 hypothetical protein I2456_03125 [Mycobacterium kubicae]GFG63636.1 hypothetical protein MKUB_11260 [Mycobacterium kubicae]
MDIVLGVCVEAAAVRLVLIEGQNADGVTVEEEKIEVAQDAGASGAAAAALAAIVGTREGATEGGYQLTSIGATWTHPDQVAPLRAQLAQHDAGSVMLVSPLLAAAALAQTVGAALDYDHIALVFVESGAATLAVVDTGDGSIVDLHRRSVGGARSAQAAELATMVAGLDAPRSRAKGVFLVGCGVDIVGIKPALEAATSLVVSVPEEPDLALARGAALASANAPLFAASTAALAYALDPGTGEVSTRGLSPTYLDVCATAEAGAGALAYSAVDDETDEYRPGASRRRPMALAAGAMGGIAVVIGAALVVSLASDVRPAATHPSQRESVQLPAVSSTPAPPAPVAEAAAPPAVEPPPARQPAPPQTVTQPPPQTVVNMAPPQQPRRAPSRQAPAPVQQAPPAATTPPAAPPAPPPPAVAPPPSPVMTMYLHLPFVSVPIPINPPPPPAPPAPAQEAPAP